MPATATRPAAPATRIASSRARPAARSAAPASSAPPVRTGTRKTPAPQAWPPAPSLTVPRTALPRRSSAELLTLAGHGLAEAAMATSASERYASAHLAALRAAAALLAERARPAPAGSSRRRPASVWRLLAAVAPEFAEWAFFFAAGAAKRAAAEAGIPSVVTTREADDLLRDAEAFAISVSESLGRVHQSGLPGSVDL